MELTVAEDSLLSFQAPVGQASLVAPVRVPHGSLLGVPGRQLTLADFPPSSSPESIESSPGEPYQRRFIPVSASPADLILGPCAPIGIWPAALARKRTSPEALRPSDLGSLRLPFSWVSHPSFHGRHLLSSHRRSCNHQSWAGHGIDVLEAGRTLPHLDVGSTGLLPSGGRYYPQLPLPWGGGTTSVPRHGLGSRSTVYSQSPGDFSAPLFSNHPSCTVLHSGWGILRSFASHRPSFFHDHVVPSSQS